MYAFVSECKQLLMKSTQPSKTLSFKIAMYQTLLLSPDRPESSNMQRRKQ